MPNPNDDRVPSHIASLQDAKTKEEAIELIRKFVDEGINSGPSIDGEEAINRILAKLAAKRGSAPKTGE